MPQMLLFPDPRPLVDRLGRDFFRQLPEQPGVYLMRDSSETVLYVGKAKNLRKRLTSYRVANPDRMPRRHLRLLRAVARVEIESCADETAALARESELLRSLRPKFNRAGTWPATPRFLVWRRAGENLELTVTQKPETGWQQLGPIGSVALRLRCVVVRLLWCGIHAEQSASQIPVGWHYGVFPHLTQLRCGGMVDESADFLGKLMAGQVDAFCEWVRSRRNDDCQPFEKSAVEADLQFLADFFASTGVGEDRLSTIKETFDNALPPG